MQEAWLRLWGGGSGSLAGRVAKRRRVIKTAKMVDQEIVMFYAPHFSI